MPFYVNSNVLVPRPDTELLVECAIEQCRSFDNNDKSTVCMIDLATGSGNVLISTLLNCQSAKFGVGIDVSRAAIDVAKRNADTLLGANDRCEFLVSDWFSNHEQLTRRILSHEKNNTDGRRTALVITANPPYLNRSDALSSADLSFEPSLALYGTADDTYRPLIESCNEFLRRANTRFHPVSLLMEIGKDMQDDVTSVATQRGWSLVKQYRDLSQIVRVLQFKPVGSE